MVFASFQNLKQNVTSWFTGSTELANCNNPAIGDKQGGKHMDQPDDTRTQLDKVVFVGHREVKLPSAHSKGKHLRFYVVDKDGHEHLAATGEDQGDAHYLYQSAPAFAEYGLLNCHNRKEVIMWLEMIMKESQQRAAAERGTELAHIGLPTPDNPEGLFFIGHRQEKTVYEDGRRCNKWYLRDQHSREHLAVVGEERETRDGHYQYKAEEPFASKSPLSCGNQNGVFHWLEQMITHYAPPGHELRAYAAGGSGDTNVMLHSLSGGAGPSGEGHAAGQGGEAESGHTPTKLPRIVDVSGRTRGNFRMTPTKSRPAAGTKQRPREVSDTGQLHGGGKRPRRAQEEGEGEAPYPMSPRSKFAPSIQAQSHRRLRGLARAGGEATPAAMTAMRRLDMGQKGAARKLVLTWLTDSLSEDEMRLMNLWHDTLRELWVEVAEQEPHTAAAPPTPAVAAAATSPSTPALFDDTPVKGLVDYSSESTEEEGATPRRPPEAGRQAPPGKDGEPGHERHAVRVILECLRELRGMYLPLRVLARSMVMGTVRQYCQHPHPAVAALASATLQHWRWLVAARVRLLTDPTLTEEPTVAPQEPLPAPAFARPAPSTSHVSSMEAQPEAHRPAISQAHTHSSTREADSAVGGTKRGGRGRGRRGAASGSAHRVVESEEDGEVAGTPIAAVKQEPLEEPAPRPPAARGGHWGRGGRRGRGGRGGRPRGSGHGGWGGGRSRLGAPTLHASAPVSPPACEQAVIGMDTEPAASVKSDVAGHIDDDPMDTDTRQSDPLVTGTLGVEPLETSLLEPDLVSLPGIATGVEDSGPAAMSEGEGPDASASDEGSDGEGSGLEGVVGGSMGGKSLPKAFGGKTVPRPMMGGKTLPRPLVGVDEDEEDEEEVGDE